MSSVPCIADSVDNMIEVRKPHPAIRNTATDQRLAAPRRLLTLEEARELAKKGYDTCLDEGLSQDYAEQYQRETQEILQKSY